MRPSLKAGTFVKTRFFHEDEATLTREREIRNVRGWARGVLLSHSKGLLPASYGITVCIHVYFGSYREPAIPLQKIITCIRVGSTFPPPRAIIAHSAGIVQFFQFFFSNPPIILSSSPLLLSFSFLRENRTDVNRDDWWLESELWNIFRVM